MNKQELMDAVADHVGAETPKDRRHVSEVVNAALAVIQQEVAEGGTVSVAKWGKFESRLHKARTARNPSTQEEVQVPATWRVRFTPGSEFEHAVAGRPV